VIQEGERGMESASSERWTRTRTELLAFLRIACAGMAAEELWFGESTTGPGGDLVGATEIAAQMVGRSA
jgi:cell division protease FtsH